jgi:hypothetical protein
MLQASSNAVHCLPDPKTLSPIANTKVYGPNSFATWELDHLLAMTFGWWDLIRPGVAAPSTEDVNAGWSNLREYLLALEREKPLARAKRVDRTGAVAEGDTPALPSKTTAKK